MNLLILADEGLNGNIVRELRNNGFEVDWVLEIEPGLSDERVIELAKERQRTLITEDKDLKTGFVDPFDEDSTRKRLYEGYVKYNSELKALLKDQKYLQWVDGSFISTRINPRDIDLVNLIDHKLVDTYQDELQQFVNRLGKEKYGIDGYIVRIYPEGHKNYIRTKSDLIYWENWFSKSRLNRRKQRFPKGFVELEF